MSTKKMQVVSLAKCLLLGVVGAAALVAAGCSNGGGSSNPPSSGGTYPPGPGTGAPIPITSAKTIVGSITKVTVPDDGRPVVEIFLRDANNYSLTGLKASSVSFVLARLEPPVNGASSTWHAITRRTEDFPGTPAPTPADRVTGTGPVNQAATESASAGTWTEKGDGVYEYRFAKSLKGDPQIPYDGTLPHRVGFEIRLSPAIPANNPVYTFNPATSSPIDASGREIVATATCNGCHERLAVHGGARVDVQYCVMCHESYSFDAQSGNTIDFKVMIHKIHSGPNLPSVAAGGFYGIFGFGNTFSDFSDVAYPQDTRYCETCHREDNAATPQASNWRLVVNRQACTSCHDDVNFATGENHGGVAATDDTCTSCHGPNSDLAKLPVAKAHEIPQQVAAAKFKYEILNVANTAPGQKPTVTIRVVDPTSNDAPYDIKAAGGPFQNASGALTVDVAYSTRPDYTNTDSGSATATTGTPAQPIRIDFKANGVADPAYTGGFTATATAAIPANAVGSGTAFLEGHPAVDADGNGSLDTLPVPAAQKDFAITDASPTPYRQIVDLAKCDTCHKQLALHGNNRVDDVQLCASCHNPNATDINRRVAGSDCEAVTGTLDDQAIDLKYMIHAIHAGAYKVCGFGNSGIDFSDVVYPGKLSNCEGCHLSGTYYPPAASDAFATTFDAGADRSTPAADVAVSPAAAACSACHVSASARQHIQLNSGTFDAVKDASSTTPGAPPETCGDCHGPGKPADVKAEHGFGQSQ